jgi:hypothetical protein
MGARDLFNSRAEAHAASAQPEVPNTGRERGKPGFLVLAAARVRGEPERAAGEVEPSPRVCTCGSLISRVSSLLGGRDAVSCERCRFFGHYSQ